MKKAVIVILNYNGEQVLKRFFPSIASLSNFPIVLIDNNSQDGSIPYLKKNFPEVGLIELEENFGYSGGYSYGLEKLKGLYHFYILLNSDVSLTSGWDISLIRNMEVSNAVAAQPKILSFEEKGYFDYSGASGGYLDLLGYPFCRGRILNSVERDQGQYDEEVEVDWASGACFGVKASDFHEAGGFDPTFFAHMEEIDLCLRFRIQKKKIFAFPQVTIFHLGGGTLPKSNPMKTYLNFRNSLIMLRKNLTFAGFLRLFVCRVLLDSAAAFHLLFTQGGTHAAAVVKAYWDFLFRVNVSKSPDKINLTGLSLLNKPIHSVIWNYYLKRNKTFASMR